MIDFKSQKNVVVLQQELYRSLPLGASIEKMQIFAKEQELTCFMEEAKNLFPSQIAETNEAFDYRITCSAQAADEKWPRSWFILSNGSIWLMRFYFQNDRLVDIQIVWASNEL